MKSSWKFIKSPNYFPGRTKPCTVLVYHYTADGPAEKTIKYFQQRETELSAHFVINRNGETTQMVELGDRAWHAGESTWNGAPSVNHFSVGIEICNWGPLIKKGDTYYCWPDNYSLKYDGLEPFKDDSGKYWENYPVVQIKALIEVTKFILEKFPTITLDNIVGHENISPGRKQDPGPAFPWETVRYELKDWLKQKEYVPEAVHEKDDVKPIKQREIELDDQKKNNPTALNIINALFNLFKSTLPKLKNLNRKSKN